MTRLNSEDLRERALPRADAGEMTRSIATALQISPSCVSKWRKLRRETGGLAPGQIGGHKQRALSGSCADWLRERLVSGPVSPAVAAHFRNGPACIQQLRNETITHMKFARFSIFTAMNRNPAISQVCDAVSEASGWIVDQSFFSNIAVTINFEMPSNSFQKFQQALQENGLKAHFEGEFPADVRGTVSLMFSHNESD